MTWETGINNTPEEQYLIDGGPRARGLEIILAHKRGQLCARELADSILEMYPDSITLLAEIERLAVYADNELPYDYAALNAICNSEEWARQDVWRAFTRSLIMSACVILYRDWEEIALTE